MGLGENVGYERPGRLDNHTSNIRNQATSELRTTKLNANERLFKNP
jgi:hypothetical protein